MLYGENGIRILCLFQFEIPGLAKDLKTSGKKSWRAYGENIPLEDFADSVAYYTFAHDQFVALFPERAKLLDAILK